MILRRIARPMMAAVFVSGGIDTLRNPKPRVDTAAPVIEKAGEQAKVKVDPATLVKVNAIAQVAAGTALGLGKFPRLSALVLAASLAPTTVAGHRFWEENEPADRGAQRTHFLKNLGLLGGLLIAAADTHGKPSFAWRAKHATGAAAAVVGGKVDGATSSAKGTVEGAVSSAKGAVEGTVSSAKGVVEGAAATVLGAVGGATGAVQGVVEGATKSARGSAKTARGTARKAAKSVEGTTKALKKKTVGVLS